MASRAKPPNEAEAPPSERKRTATERLLAEAVQQAASMDCAPTHEAPLAKKLLRNRRPKGEPRPAKPPLTVEAILAWADAHHAREGRWPNQTSGDIPEAPGETWRKFQSALNQGLRGLPGGGSIVRLLAEHRGIRHLFEQPPLSIEQILAWADSHHARTGKWPTQYSGQVSEAPEESWARIDAALREGRRGLPGGASIPQLLADQRGLRNIHTLPKLTEEKILWWADAYRASHGRWPARSTEPIEDAPEETWNAVDLALKRGTRGLPGGSSLAQLLAERRRHRNRSALPSLNVEAVLRWMDAHHARHSQWPTLTSGPIPEGPGETWSAVQHALMRGHRGLPGGSSLAKLLEEYRGVRNHLGDHPLTEDQILAWADAYYERHRIWPSGNRGVIPEAPRETWAAVDAALHQGCRGLPGNDSLAKLLTRRRGRTGKRSHSRPTLTEEQILAWADAWTAEYGRVPSIRYTEPIPGAPGENWNALDVALKLGYRGLPGGDSLSRLLRRQGRR